MTLNVSLCLGPDWIIYAWVKWSVVRLLESSAISISAMASFRVKTFAFCCAMPFWKSETRVTTEGRRRDRWQKRDRLMKRQKRSACKKQKREWQSSGRCMLFVSTRRAKCQFFVLHQWVMAAIIPPNGYKQAILAHCCHTQMKKARVLHSGDTQSQHGKWSVKACEA